MLTIPRLLASPADDELNAVAAGEPAFIASGQGGSTIPEIAKCREIFPNTFWQSQQW